MHDFISLVVPFTQSVVLIYPAYGPTFSPVQNFTDGTESSGSRGNGCCLIPINPHQGWLAWACLFCINPLPVRKFIHLPKTLTVFVDSYWFEQSNVVKKKCMWLENQMSVSPFYSRRPFLKMLQLNKKHNISHRCWYIFSLARDLLRIERATYSRSSPDAHKWWQVCVEGASSYDSFVILLQGFFWGPIKHEGPLSLPRKFVYVQLVFRQAALSFACLCYHLLDYM